MSTHIMAACWPLKLPPTPKAVLISLADQANDHAICWPSVSTICVRTCFTERTVQGAIQWLVNEGLLEVELRPGRSTNYRIAVDVPPLTPRTSCGVQQLHHTSAATAPTPAANALYPRSSRTQNRKEPSKNRKEPPKKKRNLGQVLGIDALIADGVERQHALDWLCVRQDKRAPLTLTAWANVKAEASKAGISNDEAVRTAATRGWAGFVAKWLDDRDGKQARSTAGKHAGFAERAYGEGGAL